MLSIIRSIRRLRSSNRDYTTLTQLQRPFGIHSTRQRFKNHSHEPPMGLQVSTNLWISFHFFIFVSDIVPHHFPPRSNAIVDLFVEKPIPFGKAQVVVLNPSLSPRLSSPVSSNPTLLLLSDPESIISPISPVFP